jgi:hypothetical protein
VEGEFPPQHADYANPYAVATFVEAASGTGADLLICFLVLSVGREPNEEIPIGHYPLPGAVVLLGTFRNHFGSRCVPIRKNAFSA